MAKKSKRGIITYRSYLFKEKDPVIDALRTAVQDSTLSYQDIHHASGVSVGTLNKWFYGDVRRPQFATVSAVALACGKRAIVFKAGKPVLE